MKHPSAIEGPFPSARRVWLASFARHATMAVMAGAALGLLAGLIAGRFL